MSGTFFKFITLSKVLIYNSEAAFHAQSKTQSNIIHLIIKFSISKFACNADCGVSVNSWRMPPVILPGSAPRIPITSGLVQEVPLTSRTSPSYRLTWWISRDSSGNCRSSWTTRRTRKVEISEVCTTQTKTT